MRHLSLLLLLCFSTIGVTAAPVPVEPTGDRAAKDAVRDAATALAALPTRSQDVEAWCAVAVLHHKLGDKAAAAAAVEQATACARATRTDAMRKANADRVLFTVARCGEAEAVLKRVEDLSDAADKPPAPSPRATALRTAALFAAGEGHAAAADALAAAISNEQLAAAAREEARQAIAAAAARTGGADQTARLLDGIKTADKKVEALVGRVDVYDAFNPVTDTDWLLAGTTPLRAPAFELREGIAGAKLAAGDRAGATAAARTAVALTPDVPAALRYRVLAGVVRTLARIGDVPAARQALTEMERHKPVRPAALALLAESDAAQLLAARAEVAAAEVRAGRDAEAEAFVTAATEPAEKAHLQLVVAQAQGRAGRRAAAAAGFAKVLDAIPQVDAKSLVGRSLTAKRVATAQIETGDYDAAVRTQAAAGKGETLSVWVGIVRAQARDQKFDDARKTLAEHARTFFPNSPNELTREVARLQARAGQGKQVREWIDRGPPAAPAGWVVLNTPDQWRAYALLGLAEGAYREPAKK